MRNVTPTKITGTMLDTAIKNVRNALTAAVIGLTKQTAQLKAVNANSVVTRTISHAYAKNASNNQTPQPHIITVTDHKLQTITKFLMEMSRKTITLKMSFLTSFRIGLNRFRINPTNPPPTS